MLGGPITCVIWPTKTREHKAICIRIRFIVVNLSWEYRVNVYPRLVRVNSYKYRRFNENKYKFVDLFPTKCVLKYQRYNLYTKCCAKFENSMTHLMNFVSEIYIRAKVLGHSERREEKL